MIQSFSVATTPKFKGQRTRLQVVVKLSMIGRSFVIERLFNCEVSLIDVCFSV